MLEKYIRRGISVVYSNPPVISTGPGGTASPTGRLLLFPEKRSAILQADKRKPAVTATVKKDSVLFFIDIVSLIIHIQFY